MSESRFQNFKFPETPTSRLVSVTQLSPSSEEQVVKEFFRFCGKIEEFQIIKSEDDKSQEALVLFEKESAAKTAIMLSNATIGDRLILVEPYFKDAQESSNSQPKENSTQDRSGSSDKAEGNAAASSLLSSLWTTGYQLTQTVVQTTRTIDSTYGISTQAAAYLEKAKEETKKLDEKYHVTERAVEIDSKYGIREKLNQATTTAVDYGKQALETEQGKKVHNLYEKAVSTASELKGEALRALNIETQAESSQTKNESTQTQNCSAKEPESSSSTSNETASKPKEDSPKEKN